MEKNFEAASAARSASRGFEKNFCQMVNGDVKGNLIGRCGMGFYVLTCLARVARWQEGPLPVLVSNLVLQRRSPRLGALENAMVS